MTRSVEIPEAGETAAFEALRAHEDASYWNSCACHCGATFETTELLHRHIANSVVAAALPYLVPAGDENAYHYSTEEIAAKIADRVPHADLDGFPLSQRLRIGKAVAPLFQELLPPPAPAGDGGLREALEKLCDRYDRIAAELSIRGGVKATYDIPGSELRSVLAAHPAAPAPVVGVCEHPSDIFGPCTLLQGHELHGYLHQNTKGEKWSNFGEPAHTAQPSAPAVPQPIERAVCNACGWEGEPVHDICPACRQDTLNFFTPASGSAVQPVDRKVLEIQLADELASWTDDAPASRWRVAEALAGRVLAVLAGEQEQVEP